MSARDSLLALATAIALLAGMELALRLGFPEPEKGPSLAAINEIAFETHPEYLVTIKPNLRRRPFVRRTAGGDVVTHWSTNSDSYRGPEIGPKRGRRVIVYGDSNVFARFSDDAQTFTSQLQRRLQAASPGPLEVLNAGVPGFGPDQSLLRFRDEVRKFGPDLVVFHVFADNDFGDLIRNRLFLLADDGALVRQPPPAAPDPCLTGGPCAPVPVGWREQLRDWTSSLYVTRAANKTLALAGVDLRATGPTPQEEIGFYLAVSRLEYEAYADPARGAFSTFADHYDFDLALQPDTRSARLKLALMRAVLAEARAEAARNGVALLLMIEPSSRDLTTNLSPNYTDFGQFPAYRPENLSAAVAGIGESLHIDAVNLFPVYQASRPERLYFSDGDNHWNDAGQALAAEVVARHLTAGGGRSF